MPALSFVVDTSAVVAILLAEEDADNFSSAGRQFLSLIEPELAPFDVAQMREATDGYVRYGRGSKHPANLNMGDCFSYALAKTPNLPLLFKGDDFVHTDLEPALKPG